jgi:hypothetical protein
LCVFDIDEILLSQGSRESSPSARKKEKPRKLFHESASKSPGVSSQSDPGTVDRSYATSLMVTTQHFQC